MPDNNAYLQNPFLYHTEDSLYYFSLHQAETDPSAEGYLDLTFQLIQHDFKTGSESVLDEFKSHPEELLLPAHHTANDKRLFVYGIRGHGNDRFYIFNPNTNEKVEYVVPDHTTVQLGGFDGRYISMILNVENLDNPQPDVPNLNYYYIYDMQEDQYYACPAIVSGPGVYSPYMWYFESGSLYIVEASTDQLFYRKYLIDQASPIINNSIMIGRQFDINFYPVLLPNPARLIFEDSNNVNDYKFYLLPLE